MGCWEAAAQFSKLREIAQNQRERRGKDREKREEKIQQNNLQKREFCFKTTLVG
jgi:hypothetical protein